MAVPSLIFLVLLISSIFYLGYSYRNTESVEAEYQKNCRVWKYDSNGIPYYQYSQYPEAKTSPSHVAGEILYYYRHYMSGDTEG
jgi:hypothetical protein